MKRILMMLMAVMAMANMAIGQEEETTKKKPFWEFKTGVGLGRFQDLKSSPTTLRGTVIPISISRGRSSESSMLKGGIDLNLGTLTSPLNTQTEVSSRETRFYFTYLKKLNTESKLFAKWFLGGQVDIRTQSLTNDRLGNNSSNSIFSNSLSVVNRFERPLRVLKSEVTLSYDLSVALLSFARETNSFAFSVPQTAIENGDFNTQDFDPGPYKYGELTSVNKFNSIRSRIALHFPAKHRSSWVLAYEWKLIKYVRLKNYGVTSATHTISITRHLPKKKK